MTDYQQQLQQLGIQAGDSFKSAAIDEFFGNFLFEPHESNYYLFQPTEIGDGVWLYEITSRELLHEIVHVNEKDKLQRKVVPQICTIVHCENIEIEDRKVAEIERKIKSGGLLLGKKSNKTFTDVLLGAISDTNKLRIENSHISDVLTEGFEHLSRFGLYPNVFLFPQHLEARLVAQGVITRDNEIAHKHYIGKTISGQHAFRSADLPRNTALMLDKSTCLYLTKEQLVKSEVARLGPFRPGICGYLFMNPIVKNVNGILAIENIEQLTMKRPAPIPEISQTSPFSSVLLENEQKDLLIYLVEFLRNQPRDKRAKFIVQRTINGESLIYPGKPNPLRLVFVGDLEVLAREQMVDIAYLSNRTPVINVLPLASKYYEYLKGQVTQPTENLTGAIRSYLDGENFRQRHPNAYQKWLDAEVLLWKSDSESQLTTIGHFCREAFQEFAASCIQHKKIQGFDSNPANVISRVRTVLDAHSANLGKTEKPFLDALLVYWVTVNDLIQRQEHGAQRDGEALIWEDARRVVFQTALIMFEIDSALFR
jgi:hypothetical protein